MPRDTVYLNSIVHANPCPQSWEAMPGDDWKRFCGQCGQSVYNLSAMTAREAEALLERHEGRVCTKVYRRPDGTVLTQRCPSSIRKALVRVGRWVAAAGLAVPAFAHEGCFRSAAKITRESTEQRTAVIEGVVMDASGAVIPGVVITVRRGRDEPRNEETNSLGRFSIGSLPAGVYEVWAVTEGFSSFRDETIAVAEGERLTFEITMQVGSVGGNAAAQPIAPKRGQAV